MHDLLQLATDLGPWAATIAAAVAAVRSDRAARHSSAEAERLRASSDAVAVAEW